LAARCFFIGEVVCLIIAGKHNTARGKLMDVRVILAPPVYFISDSPYKIYRVASE
jgi:hypothetical protein